MFTQCPACGMRFRITGSQLGRAGGRVRCGACLEIFLAPASLSDEDGDSAPASAGAGETDGIASDEGVSERPGRRQVGVRESAAKAGSGSAQEQSAHGGTGYGRWVRWTLVIAVLTLILQVVLYLA